MYSFNSRVRYSEIDKNKTLDLASIINYFQDCSTFQSEDIGKGVTYLEQKKRAWLMNSWQIIVKRFPSLCENIKVSTWAYDFKAMYGYRNFIIEDEKGNLCATANSIWVFMDTETLRPTKITEDDISGYGHEPRFEMDYAPRKIKLPEDFKCYPDFPVVMSNIDTNNHVNNGQYIKMAEEYLPDDFKIRQMRAEYQNSALLGDIIVPKVSINSSTYTVVLSNQNDKPYAIIEFERN